MFHSAFSIARSLSAAVTGRLSQLDPDPRTNTLPHLAEDPGRVLVTPEHEEGEPHVLVYRHESKHVRREELVLVRDIYRLQHLDAFNACAGGWVDGESKKASSQRPQTASHEVLPPLTWLERSSQAVGTDTPCDSRGSTPPPSSYSGRGGERY